MQSMDSSLGQVFASPAGQLVLILAGLAALAVIVWWFWQRNDVAKKAKSVPEAVSTVPPPMLKPELHSITGTAVQEPDYMWRNALIGVVTLAGVAIILNFALSNRVSEPAPAEEPPAPPAPEVSLPPLMESVACTGTRVYRNMQQAEIECGEQQRARFDRISFERNGMPLLDLHWHGTSGTIAMADNQPVPFTLAEVTDLLPPPGQFVEDYDFFIALGLPNDSENLEDPMSGESAAFIRSEQLLDVGFAAVQDQIGGGCTDDKRIYRVTFEGRAAGMEDQPVPVLIGVKFDERYNAADRDADRLIDDFFASNAVMITGIELSGYTNYTRYMPVAICPLHRTMHAHSP